MAKESIYNLDEVIEKLSDINDSKYWDNIEIILCLANEIKRLNNILDSHGIYE